MINFQPFLNAFSSSSSNGIKLYDGGVPESFADNPSDLRSVLTQHGGSSFECGLYRLHSPHSSCYWNGLVAEYFTSYKNRISCFGFDWLGRQYAIDANKVDTIYMFDPSTGEVFELGQSFSDFHNNELVNHGDETLSAIEFKKWLSQSGKPLKFNQCIGFKVSLFLGGIDRIENYDLCDLEVHWELSYQLYRKAQGLPEATLINKVDWQDEE